MHLSKERFNMNTSAVLRKYSASKQGRYKDAQTLLSWDMLKYTLKLSSTFKTCHMLVVMTTSRVHVNPTWPRFLAYHFYKFALQSKRKYHPRRNVCHLYSQNHLSGHEKHITWQETAFYNRFSGHAILVTGPILANINYTKYKILAIVLSSHVTHIQKNYRKHAFRPVCFGADGRVMNQGKHKNGGRRHNCCTWRLPPMKDITSEDKHLGGRHWAWKWHKMLFCPSLAGSRGQRDFQSHLSAADPKLAPPQNLSNGPAHLESAKRRRPKHWRNLSANSLACLWECCIPLHPCPYLFRKFAPGSLVHKICHFRWFRLLLQTLSPMCSKQGQCLRIEIAGGREIST